MPSRAHYNPDEVAALAKKIMHHKAAYYRGRPEISDVEYDKLEAALAKLSPRHPVLTEIGAEPAKTSNKVEHDVPMLSLQKTYVLADLMQWAKDHQVIGTLKVDGNSLSIIYEDGKVVLAKTRGNGRIGEDVTAKIAWVADIIPEIPVKGRCEIRGELYCTDSQFLRLSEEMADRKLERPTNPRNVVAGVLGRKTHFDLACYFNFFAFDVVDPAGTLTVATEHDKYSRLQGFGFRVPDPRVLTAPQEIEDYLEHVRKILNEDEIGLDGAVFAYDNLTLHNELGNTSHHPRYKMSFKWQGDTATSTIKTFTWATSRRGIVTPVAVIEPVNLSGAMITNITLHNAAHVMAHNLKAGDEIEIVRSGEVIPKFLRVVSSAPGEYQWPDGCPSCGSPLDFDDVRLKCTNKESCPAQQMRSILNWIRSVEIDDLSEKRLVPLIDAGLVSTPADLYRLSKDDLQVIPNTKEKMATKLFANIEKSRKIPLERFLLGLGIEGTGLTSWEKLLVTFGSLEELRRATPEALAAVEGFAAKSAEQIADGLREKADLIDDLLKAGVSPFFNPVVAALSSDDLPLSGKTLVITGALSRPRGEIEAVIKEAGGKTSGSVSKQTFAVVTGEPDSNSSKMKKARELGVAIWSEADLWDHVKTTR